MQSPRSRRFLFALLILVPVLVGTDAALKHSPSIGVQPDESIMIPTGQALTPAGHHLNRAIWHSVKGFSTSYNYGKPIKRQHPSFESLLRLTGS